MKNDRGESVRWTEIREVKIEVDNPDILNIKYDFCDDSAQCSIKLESKLKRKQNNDLILKPAYNKLIPIGLKKYQHLQYLCKHSVPEAYHNFYKSLPYVKKTNSSDSEDD